MFYHLFIILFSMGAKPRAKRPIEIDLFALGSQINKTNDFLRSLTYAQYLSELVKRESHLEITAPPDSDVVWFRYVFDGVDEQDLAGVNRMILYELWAMGNKMMLDDRVMGKYTLKACELSKLSVFSDLDILVEQVTSIGDVLVREYL